MIKRCEEVGEEVTPLTPLEKLVFRCYNAYSTPATHCKIGDGDNDKSVEQIQSPRETEFFPVQEVLIMKVQQGHQNPHHLIEIIHLLPLKKRVLFHLLHCLGHPSLLTQITLVIPVAIQVVAKYYLQKK